MNVIKVTFEFNNRSMIYSSNKVILLIKGKWQHYKIGSADLKIFLK